MTNKYIIKTTCINTYVTRINDKLISFDHWDSEAIDTRQGILYNLSLEIWE